MNIKVLGTQAPYVRYGHNGPGCLVTTVQGDNILLDCGSGSTHMMKLPDDLENLTVIITHRHGDHWADLFQIMYASYMAHEFGNLNERIKVYIPADMNHVARMEDFHWCEFINIFDGLNFYVGGLNVKFYKTIHADSVESYAVKLSGRRDGTLVYTGDISYKSKERIVNMARGADLLVSESTLLESYGQPEYNVHITAKQAATMALEAGVSKLLLTHFKPEEDPDNYVSEAMEVFPNTLAAIEGLNLRI